jgi:hypothetical protein
MHVDYIGPPNGSDAEVYNVSVFPTTFYTEYAFDSTSSTSLSKKSTTSYTYAYKGSASEKVSYGIPDIADVSVKATRAASGKDTNSVASNYSITNTEVDGLDVTTTFDDWVSYTSSRLNVYSYPVIGHTVCPEGSPDCPAQCGEGVSSCPKQPLHVQFSGPDSIGSTVGKGATIEWYQPVHEPGNLFSYPGSLAQLQSDQPAPTSRFNQLAPPEDEIKSWGSQSNLTTEITWLSNESSKVTSNTKTNHSFDASGSIAGSVDFGEASVDISAKFDYNSSKSLSTLITSTASLDSSQGVTVSSYGTDETLPESVVYDGQTFIFGVDNPAGTLQNILPLLPDVDGGVTLDAQGPLRVGFVADLSNAGDWWQQTYDNNGLALDVGLNHPQRWTQQNPSDETPGPQLIRFNCPLDQTSSFDSPECAPDPVVTRDRPKVLDNKPFYQMKGLFVRNGDLVTSGPTTYSATAGDTLTLQARIYNFSLAAMPEGTKVHADFYAQPFDKAGGGFQSQPGDANAFAQAVYIGSAEPVEGMPAFCPGPSEDCGPDGTADTRNWAYAEITWQTPASDQATNWKFWVVTWMERDGALVEEIAGHGLQAIPAAGLNSFIDVPIETYSNNLGFYNQRFTLLPAGGDPAGDALAAAAEAEPELAIELAVPRDERRARGHHWRRSRDQSQSAEATLTSNVPLRDVILRFYEGDPTDGGTRLFDADPADLGPPFEFELIPYLAAGDPYVVAVNYRPEGCGIRWLLAEAVAMGGPVAPASATTRSWVRGDRGCRQSASPAR